MYGKYKKRVSHAGLEKIKLICTVNVTELVVANSTMIQPGSVLSICFEKGGKISTSNEIIYDVSKNKINPLRSNANVRNVTIPIDEKVELVLTMYKNLSTGKYQDKVGKLILRQLKRHAGLGMDGFKSIGVCLLQLHELVQGVDRSKPVTKDCTLYLEELPGCSLSALIHIKFLQPRPSVFGPRHSVSGVPLHGNAGEEGESADDGDDAVSIGSTVSGGSAFSTLGASFYYNDLEEYYGAGEGIVGLSGDVHSGISDSYTFGRPTPSTPEPETQPTRNKKSPFVTSPQRRYSGVVEAVHQAERKPIRSFLSKKSSHIGTGSRTDLTAFGSGNNISGANLSEAEFMDSARSPPLSPTPDDPANFSYAPTDSHELTSFPDNLVPALHIPVTPDPSQARAPGRDIFNQDEGGDYVDVDVGGEVKMEHSAAGVDGVWTSVTSAERDRTSSLGSPVRLSSPKALHTRTASTDTYSRSPQHQHHSPHHFDRQQRTHSNVSSSSSSAHLAYSPAALTGSSNRKRPTTEHSTPTPASPRAVYDNTETFALLEKELELRAERIAALEARLDLQEKQHGEEMLLVRSELLAAQAEVRILSQIPPTLPAPPVPPVESPGRTETAKLESKDVGTQHEPSHELFVTKIDAATETEASNEADKEEYTNTKQEDDLQEQYASQLQERHQQELHEDRQQEVPLLKEYASAHSQTHSEAVTSRACQTEFSPKTETETQTESPQLLVAEIVSNTESNEVSESKNTENEVPPAAIAALLSEYGRSAAQVQLLASDLVYYKQQAEEALRAKADETLAAREAATVAVQACMRRADCEQELEESVYQLRELQHKHARLSIEYEAEVRRSYSLKARLQLYAQKLSALEVDYTLSLEDAAV